MGWFHKKSAPAPKPAEGRIITTDEWMSMPDAEKCACVLETGMFGITQSTLICVDFADIIPNCLALSLLMMARASDPAAKRQLIDAGDGCDGARLLAVLERIAPCDKEWSFHIM